MNRISEIFAKFVHDRTAPADMLDMELQSIGLAGLEKAQEKLQQSARRLASLSSPDGNRAKAAYAGKGPASRESAISEPANGLINSGEDRIDLSAEMVALKESQRMAEANLKVVETANEMSSRVIDILA
ncbi:hypothetical protein QQ054_27680 [Oscillatoria amoena NRMC-F 0135]|nr:hypothetical protein [Oscillatoria amoena NRMC-F 0135]